MASAKATMKAELLKITNTWPARMDTFLSELENLLPLFSPQRLVSPISDGSVWSPRIIDLSAPSTYPPRACLSEPIFTDSIRRTLSDPLAVLSSGLITASSSHSSSSRRSILCGSTEWDEEMANCGGCACFAALFSSATSGASTVVSAVSTDAAAPQLLLLLHNTIPSGGEDSAGSLNCPISFRRDLRGDG
eukprot:GHVS01103083.1.p2 GENE.GHVS01103083.1~~GHVS01103083.1.p2  ORF type:complete len:191 (-),score=17.88 GHVS01103083.1:561-1133(-)